MRKRRRQHHAKGKDSELGESMHSLPSGHVAGALRKSESLTIRLTSAEKEEMRRAATGYGLTITDYLTRLAKLERELATNETRAKKRKSP